jgi:hypothetical protein
MAANGYANPDVLVETSWVADHLNDPNIRLVEADEDILLYDQGHIPGAVKLDWLVDVQNPLSRDFVDKAGFEKLMSSWGIANDTTGRVLRRPEQLVRGVQLLAVQVLRPREGADHERRPGQVARREPPDQPRRARRTRRRSTRPRSRTRASARSATTSRRRSGTRRSRWSTSARRRVHRREAPHGRVRAGGRPAGRARPWREEHPVGDRRERGRHVQVGPTSSRRSTAARASRRTSR